MARMTIRPPFRMLDPGLVAAEAILRAVGDRCPPDDPVSRSVHRMVDALPTDEAAATRHLNSALATSGARPQLRWRAGRPYLSFESGRAVRSSDHAPALCMLAVLVAVDGWRRIRACDRCGRPYLDRTHGATRRNCADHLAGRRAGNQPRERGV